MSMPDYTTLTTEGCEECVAMTAELDGTELEGYPHDVTTCACDCHEEQHKYQNHPFNPNLNPNLFPWDTEEIHQERAW